MRDDEGARSLISVTRVSVLFLVLYTLASVVLVGVVAAFMFASSVGGVDVALSIVEGIRSERPRVFVGVLVVGLGTVGLGLLLIVGFVLQTRRAFDKQVHIRVTDSDVTVRREGGSYWESSGVEIPFDAITSVEYLDPDESSIRIELGDWRAKRFYAGRSQQWIRIERGTDSPVYVGSDRPVELAETVARKAPGVENAEPF